jgi:hypothetical protein
MNEVSLESLAEQHLVNVQRQITALNEQKNQLDVEIQRLTDYFNKGAETLRAARTRPAPSSASVAQSVLG